MEASVVAGVVIGVGDASHAEATACDVVVERDPDLVVAAVERNPLAAAALARLLRSTESADVESALVSESATYSALQAGPEHAAWLAQRGAARQRDEPDEGPVIIARVDDVLRLTLNRPDVRNAFSAAMRDALFDALDIAALDPSVREVRIAGNGLAFCSGGDLDEFGTLPDPATAHLIRIERNVGRSIHRLRERVTVAVHGSCVGAGVELPAFAGRVVADADTTFRLPEVAMGLVPGAGGTVSLPRRIGRHRTAWLALTGTAIDASTALDWGLVDEVSERRSSG